MIYICPSMLACDFANIQQEISRIPDADFLHLDVMDGNFVPNISFGIPVIESMRKVSDAFFDVHLMIEKPQRYIDVFCDAGANLLSIHLEADHPTGIRAALDKMEKRGVKKAVALRPITSANAILPYIRELDMVLIMTVEPGFGGQKFMESQLETIRQTRKIIDEYNPSCLLQVDGGITAATAPLAIAAGANALVAGSSVFGAACPNDAIALLKKQGGDA